MVASPDIRETFQPSAAPGPVQGGGIHRAAARFVGAILVLASVGIWLVPIATADAFVVIMKLLVSVSMACFGAVLVEYGRNLMSEEVHLDPLRNELRHIRKDSDGRSHVVARFDFAELKDIRMTDGFLNVIDLTGEVVLKLPAGSVENLPVLRAALGNTLQKAG